MTFLNLTQSLYQALLAHGVQVTPDCHERPKAERRLALALHDVLHASDDYGLTIEDLAEQSTEAVLNREASHV